MDLLAQEVELLGLDLRPPLVDLRVRAAGRVDHGCRCARFVSDADEVVEDRLGGQLLDDPDAGATAREAGGDDRDVHPLQGPGDVDALAAGEGQAATCAMSLPSLEVRHGQRAVERSVEGDGDDHENQPTTFLAVCREYQPARARGPGRSIDRAPPRGARATIPPPARTRPSPSRSPSRTGNSMVDGATISSTNRWSSRAAYRTGRRATSA